MPSLIYREFAMVKHSGRCLCRDIRYEFDGPPLWVAHCHCESCRRQTSSMLATFVGVEREKLRWLGAEPARYESSASVLRSFCARCGSPVSFESEPRFPGEVHLYHGTLDDPDALVPTVHVHAAEQVSWFEVHDELPRFDRSGKDAQPSRLGHRMRIDR
jgi:hypothetical protein